MQLLRKLLLFFLITPAFGAGTINGLDFATWNGVAIAGWNGTSVSVVSPDPGGTIANLAIGFDDTSSGANAHEIELQLDAGGAITTAALGLADNYHLFEGLVFNTLYDVRIYTLTALGVRAGAPTEVSIYTAPDLPPTGVTVNSTGMTTQTVSWTPPATLPITGYLVQRSPDGSSGWTTSGTAAVGTNNLAITGLTGSTPYYYRVFSRNANPSPHEQGLSTASATGSATTLPDSLAPVLTSPTAVSAGSTSGLLGVTTTNDANGTIYWYVSTSVSPPASAPDLINNTPTAAFHGTSAVTAEGAQTKTADGLTLGVTYYMHCVHQDAIGNNSNIESSGAFVPSLDYLTGLRLQFVAENVNSGSYIDNADVTVWQDTGSLAVNLVNPGGVFLPKIRTDVVNTNKDVVRFLGLPERMDLAATVNTGPDYTIMFVIDPSAQASGTAYGMILGDTSGFNFHAKSSGNLSLFAGTELISSAVSGWSVVTFTMNAAGAWQWYVNGVAGTSGAGHSTPGGNLTRMGIDLYSSHLKASIREIRLYNAVLSTPNRQAAESALGTENGITITHP